VRVGFTVAPQDVHTGRTSADPVRDGPFLVLPNKMRLQTTSAKYETAPITTAVWITARGRVNLAAFGFLVSEWVVGPDDDEPEAGGREEGAGGGEVEFEPEITCRTI